MNVTCFQSNISRHTRGAKLLDFDLFVYFRLHSDGSSPGLFCVSPGQPRGVNPHSQDGTMTNICINPALRLLVTVRGENSRSETTRGWQLHIHLLPSPLPYRVFLPLLSTKISFVRKNLFSSTFLKEGVIEKGTGSFRSCFLWKKEGHRDSTAVSLKMFLSLLPSNLWIFSCGFNLGGSVGVWCTHYDVYIFSLLGLCRFC